MKLLPVKLRLAQADRRDITLSVTELNVNITHRPVEVLPDVRKLP